MPVVIVFAVNPVVIVFAVNPVVIVFAVNPVIIVFVVTVVAVRSARDFASRPYHAGLPVPFISCLVLGTDMFIAVQVRTVCQYCAHYQSVITY